METIGVKFAFGAACGGSLSLENVEAMYAARCAEAAAHLSDASESAEGFGWLGLPEADISDAKEAAAWLRDYDSVIHVGIGGSALGNLMLNQALLDEFYNEQTHAERGGPKFYLADNPDPQKAVSIWEQARKGTVALVGVSKSGATAETMSQFLWFREQMSTAFPGRDINKDTLVITDPVRGIFRSFARESGCRSLVLPASVGGRYSVLSNAGLASAAALGIDIDSLLQGAARMKRYLTLETRLAENPARLAAALHVLHETEKRPMSVLMPYSSKLAYFAEWFAQLWGESLGKNGMGTTPVRALGAIDQHSQVQLYTEGPDDKFYTLINVRQHGKKVCVPRAEEESLRELSYMGGAEIGEMLGLEAVSTAAALAKAGRPLVWMEIDRIDAGTIGALVYYYEYMTALTGGIMLINPFDQPGVEQGKRYTYGLMGRDGYKKDAEEAQGCFGAIENHTIDLKI